MKMEHHKISNLLNDSTVSGFVTRKWIEVNNLSAMIYDFDNTFIDNALIVMLMYNLLVTIILWHEEVCEIKRWMERVLLMKSLLILDWTTRQQQVDLLGKIQK